MFALQVTQIPMEMLLQLLWWYWFHFIKVQGMKWPHEDHIGTSGQNIARCITPSMRPNLASTPQNLVPRIKVSILKTWVTYLIGSGSEWTKEVAASTSSPSPSPPPPSSLYSSSFFFFVFYFVLMARTTWTKVKAEWQVWSHLWYNFSLLSGLFQVFLTHSIIKCFSSTSHGPGTA